MTWKSMAIWGATSWTSLISDTTSGESLSLSSGQTSLSICGLASPVAISGLTSQSSPCAKLGSIHLRGESSPRDGLFRRAPAEAVEPRLLAEGVGLFRGGSFSGGGCLGLLSRSSLALSGRRLLAGVLHGTMLEELSRWPLPSEALLCAAWELEAWLCLWLLPVALLPLPFKLLPLPLPFFSASPRESLGL